MSNDTVVLRTPEACTCGWVFPVLAVGRDTNRRNVEVTCPRCKRIWAVNDCGAEITGCAPLDRPLREAQT